MRDDQTARSSTRNLQSYVRLVPTALLREYRAGSDFLQNVRISRGTLHSPHNDIPKGRQVFESRIPLYTVTVELNAINYSSETKSYKENVYTVQYCARFGCESVERVSKLIRDRVLLFIKIQKEP